MRKILSLLITVALCIPMFQPLTALGQQPLPPVGPVSSSAHDSAVSQEPKDKDKDEPPKGAFIKSFRKNKKNKKDPPPDWVDKEVKRSKDHLKKKARGLTLGILDPDAELEVLAVDEDNLDLTHTRLDQVYQGVPVYSGQIITHLNSADEGEVISGRVYKEARHVDTKPKLKPKEAIKAAEDALGYAGEFAVEPEAELVILPYRFYREGCGATLTYQVELLIEDGTAATARWFYFVNAHDGSIVWRYDAMNNALGYGLYNGPVHFPTWAHPGGYVNGTYYKPGFYLRDVVGTYGGMETSDMQGGIDNNDNGSAIYDRDHNDLWGNRSDIGNCDQYALNWPRISCGSVVPWVSGPNLYYYHDQNYDYNRQKAAVDAHWGMLKTWEYLWDKFRRRGIDNGALSGGRGYGMLARVHYGSIANNSSDQAYWNGRNIAFGDGDGGLSGPLTSLDIVGHEYIHGLTEKTANLNPFGESGGLDESFGDIFGVMIRKYATGVLNWRMGGNRPGGTGDLVNPSLFGHADHYNSRTNYNVDIDSGISNKAFSLLYSGGTHSLTGVSVIGIDDAAEWIFYRALTCYLTPGSSFYDARVATLCAARDGYTRDSVQFRETANAWHAVGVKNSIDDTRFFVEQQYRDILNRAPISPEQNGWINVINSCGPNDACINSQRIVVARGFFESPELRNSNPLLQNPGTDTYNREYVRLCYWDFLRRNPDPIYEIPDYEAWVNFINATGDYNTLVWGFITSVEYRNRFALNGQLSAWCR